MSEEIIYTKEDLALQMLSILVFDLEYYDEPWHGHDPMRHQFAWEMVVRTLGIEKVREEIKKDIDDVRENRNGAVKESTTASYYRERNYPYPEWLEED